MKKPTQQEIYSYMVERDFDDFEQSEMFYDHFESNGWRVGKNQMKNWKAAVRNWIRNAKKWGHDEKRQSDYQSFADRQREQADQARRELDALSGVREDNVTPIRSAGRSVRQQV